MNIIWQFAFLISVCNIAKVCCIQPEDLITEDNLELIFNDDGLRTVVHECFMDWGPCDHEHAETLKELVPTFFSTHCRNCTEQQRAVILPAVMHLMLNHIDLLQNLMSQIARMSKKKGILLPPKILGQKV